MTERFYVPTIKYFLGEPVRVIEVNNVEYLICKDMFSVLGRVRADGTWDDAKKKLFNFTKPLTTICDPEIFGVTCRTDKLKSRDTQEVLCIRLEDAPIIASQYRPPQTKPLVLQKWNDFIDWLNILIKENSESNPVVKDKNMEKLVKSISATEFAKQIGLSTSKLTEKLEALGMIEFSSRDILNYVDSKYLVKRGKKQYQVKPNKIAELADLLENYSVKNGRIFELVEVKSNKAE